MNSTDGHEESLIDLLTNMKNCRTVLSFQLSNSGKTEVFAITGASSVTLSAIIEPTLCGLLVKNKKLYFYQIIGGAVGGACLGFTKVVMNAFVFGSVTTFPAFIGEYGQCSNRISNYYDNFCSHCILRYS